MDNQNGSNNVNNNPNATISNVNNVNTESGITQQNSQPISNTKGKVSEQAKQLIKEQKNKKTIILIVILAVILIIVGYKIIGGLNLIGNGGLFSKGEEEIKFDTGFNWADAYGDYTLKFFDNLKIEHELEVDRFDVAFVDFNFDNVPEMALRFLDQNEKYVVKVFQYNNKEVNESRDFVSSQFRLVYSSITNEVNWYLYVSTNSKYGSYALMKKILDNNVKTADMKVTNETDLTSFNKKYLVSDYRIDYYEVKKYNLLDDYATAVGRYKGYNEEASKEKQKLLDETVNWNTEEPGEIKTSITVGNYTLNFGDYIAEVSVFELGVEKRIEKTITLKDGYLIVDGVEVAYDALPTFIYVSNGFEFKVLDNNTFTYGSGGAIYRLEE